MQWNPSSDALSFSNSMRFGNSIAELVARIRIDTEMPISGNPNRQSLAPHIITYSDGEITEVIRAFGALVNSLELPIEGHVYKAVGWVKQENEKGRACIPHYCPSYTSPHRPSQSLKSFWSYFLSYNSGRCGKHSPRDFKNLIWAGLQVFGKLCSIAEEPSPARTSRAFEAWLKTVAPASHKYLSELIAIAISALTAGGDCKGVYRLFVDRLSSEGVWPLGMNVSHKAIAFLQSEEVDPSCERDVSCNLVACIEGPLISVGTVHAVKGETHTGTLLLETKYQRKHDGEYLMEYLKGAHPRKASGQHLRSAIKIAHVAMSRPTHLFVFACPEDRLKGHIEELRSNNWAIYTVQELLN